MSVVVAIKDEDRVWMACDSQTTAGYTRNTLKSPNNYKINRPKDEVDTLTGCVGATKLGNIINIQDRFIDELTTFKNEFNFKYMVEKIVPKITNLASQYGVADKASDQSYYTIDGALLFANKDKLYHIYSDGCVIEIEDHIAIGSGARLSIGYLNQSEGENPKDRIIKAVKSACETDLYVNYPIIVTNTVDHEFIIIEE